MRQSLQLFPGIFYRNNTILNLKNSFDILVLAVESTSLIGGIFRQVFFLEAVRVNTVVGCNLQTFFYRRLLAFIFGFRPQPCSIFSLSLSTRKNLFFSDFFFHLVLHECQIRTGLVRYLEIFRVQKFFSVALIILKHYRVPERKHHPKVTETRIIPQTVYLFCLFVVLIDLDVIDALS